MSKSSQNKEYYEIGIYSPESSDVVAEYVTQLPIVEGGRIHQKLMDFIYKKHSQYIFVLFNKKNGAIPKDKDEIKLRIPKKDPIKYNK